MAITPRSRGLSNIGNIVNRQGMVSPTRPMSQPMARPVAQPMPRSTVQPVTGGRTTLAQRQAMTPFRNYNTPPVAKMNPLTYVANQQAMTQQPPPPMNLPDIYGYPVEDASFQPQPFNQNPNPVSNMGGGGMPQQQYQNYSNAVFGTPNSSYGGGKSVTGPGMIMDMVERDQYGNPIGGEYSPSPQQQYQNYSNVVFGNNPNSVSTPNFGQPPQPFNPNPNPVSNMGGGSMPQQQYNQYANAAFGGGKSGGR
jgi:hypothetical protein